MLLRSLYLKQFRNYCEEAFDFSPHVNLIYGPNARGKTTILEAIYTLMLGRSFRANQQSELIKIGYSYFYLEAIFNKHGIDQKLRMQGEAKERKIILNSTTFTNVSNLLGVIQGVIMTPDEVNLIKGSPVLRRQYIDLQIAQVDPLYIHYLTRYAKAIKQRNQLLKQKKITTIEVWEHEMAQAAAYIIKQRKKTIEELLHPCRQFYSYLTEEKDLLNILYRSYASSCHNEEIKDFTLTLLQKNRHRELIVGFTLTGPHKDDLSIEIGEQEARFFGSEGQQRSCAIALHIGAWKRLKKTSEDVPLFMIDDAGISLDKQRKSKLLEQLGQLGQVFLTATDKEILDSFSGEKHLIYLA